ncbi:MAG: glycosyltransferase family 2 protein [Rhodospirillaceae bacterium]
MLTVITPCLNRHQTIRRAIESVRKQDYKYVEHIVVDGCSTDGTLAILDEYQDVRVISEPDINLYDAINKGIMAAQGDVVCHLNSDDIFLPGAFSLAMTLFTENVQLEMVSGGAEVIEHSVNGGERVIARHNSFLTKSLRERDVISGVPIINARFFHRTVYDRVGFYDLRFPLAADREFLLRVIIAKINNHVLPQVVYRYYSHSGSLTFAGSSVGMVLARANYHVAHQTYCDNRKDRNNIGMRRRWLAWTVGYLIRCLLGDRRAKEALQLGCKTMVYDFAWLIRFLHQTVGHWHERSLRQ